MNNWPSNNIVEKEEEEKNEQIIESQFQSLEQRRFEYQLGEWEGRIENKERIDKKEKEKEKRPP